MRSPLTPPPRNRLIVWIERLLTAISLVGIAAWGVTAHERVRFQQEARETLQARAAARAPGSPGGLLAVWNDVWNTGARASVEPAGLETAGTEPAGLSTTFRLEPDQPFGTLEIPRLGVDVVIVEGTSDKALKNAVGHMESTAWPGQIGTSAIAGHRDTFFRPLKDIAVSDTLVVVTPEGRIEYVVDSLLVVKPQGTEFLYEPRGNRLLLITCYPFHYIGNAPSRFIVQARPLPERVGGRPEGVGEPERASISSGG